MKAIILAAGRGSRMKSMTAANPKCLVELHGKPLLEHQLSSLRGAGISEIAIVTGYRADMLRGRATHEFHNPRWAETNMVSSLAVAAEWLDEEACIVSYSDIFYEPLAVKSLMKCDADLAITFDPNWERLWTDRFGDPLLDAETFRKAESGVLLEIGQKPKKTLEVEGQYMGLLRFSPAGWAEMQSIRQGLPDAQRDQLDMTSALQAVLENGKVPIQTVPYDGTWGEIDSAEDLAVYQN
ncbi:MAG: phosphocholine cytidylyltransferase family protein [Litoreibacter sp.]|nr:phosphocholine cytidylyltransferase family protein [Litoreibacter sp.]